MANWRLHLVVDIEAETREEADDISTEIVTHPSLDVIAEDLEWIGEGTEPEIACSRCGARYAEDPSCGKTIHDTLPNRPIK